MKKKILVCGGRDFNDRARVFKILNVLLTQENLDVTIIHGAAKGADFLAGEWAAVHGIPVEEFPADWDTHGKKAGYVRNAQMLEEGKPDIVLAFPGGKGTEMMKSLARKKNIPVHTVLNMRNNNESVGSHQRDQ